MDATLAHETLEIVGAETPTEQEEDQIGYDIDYYPSDFTLRGYYEEWNAKRIILSRVPASLHMGPSSSQQTDRVVLASAFRFLAYSFIVTTPPRNCR